MFFCSHFILLLSHCHISFFSASSLSPDTQSLSVFTAPVLTQTFHLLLCKCPCVCDQNAYDMAELQKSLQPSPAQSVQYCRSRALHHPPPPHHHHHHLLHQAPPVPPSSQPLDTLSRTTSSTTLPPSAASTSSTATTTTSLRRDVPPTRLPAQGQARPSQLARRSLSFSSQDLARYLCEIIRDADQHPDTGPFDSLQVFSTEGGGSPAGSLSSFSSAGLDGGSSGEGGAEARREETLGEWGPRFEKLRALYERAEASDL